MDRSRRFLPAVALALLAATACAPVMNGDAELAPAAAVTVINEMPHPVVVWFDDGTGERLLGTVARGGRDRFVLAGTTATTVSVIARDEAGTHTVRRTVALRGGGAVDVRIN
jgi:hypothetical protein